MIARAENGATDDGAREVLEGIDTCWYNPLGQARPDDDSVTYEIADLVDLHRIMSD